MGHIGLILGALGVILLTKLCKFLVFYIWRPYVITKRFKRQGIMGPKYKFMSGSLEEMARLKKEAIELELDINSHDVCSRVLPHYIKWINQYGGLLLYWVGAIPRLCITDAEMVKQILTNKFGYFAKPDAGLFLGILGKGLGFTDGLEWARHRRVVAPAFTINKLKMMTKQMAECTQSMLNNWNDEVSQADGQHTSIEVNQHFKELTADVISHCAFGSSYNEGKEVFLAQNKLLTLILDSSSKSYFPGYNYLPTKFNQQKWALERKLRNTLLNIINGRLNSKDSGHGNDLLGLMIESTQKDESMKLSIDEIIDECKTFFFGGHETTSNLLTWTMFLLSTNPEWQDKLRDEVSRECGMEIPNADDLSKLKLVNMVILETLRLYSPVLLIIRDAAQDIKLGKLMIPKGTAISIPFALIHQQEELWGANANKFDPPRFENGVNKAAKHPSAMLAFGIGPRACVGQTFAMLEAKLAVAMIVQRFSFSLSPEYKHKPVDNLTLQPQHGLQIVLKPLAACTD